MGILDSLDQVRSLRPSGVRAIQDSLLPGGNQSRTGERNSPEPFAFGCVIFNCQHTIGILAYPLEIAKASTFERQ
ncbi:MAG: hypothetical protein KDH08_01240, partial [Anaerolineae bacterium]|nr:hypothetical protein [Anaerolineae bacterium]MCB0237270.1 hypothetical protein [Anaerolineae bacterium]